MLEFYQAYSDYQDLMKLTEEMIGFVARSAVGRDEVEFNGETISLRAPFARVSLRQAAADAAAEEAGRSRSPRATCAIMDGEGPRRRVSASPSIRRAGPARSRRRSSRRSSRSRSCSRRSSTTFQPRCRRLSKQRPDDPDTVERFELYIGKMEMANAFSELNDPDRAAEAVRAAARRARQGRPGSARDGRGLRPRARIRPAADRRRRRGRRSPRDAADRQQVHPRRHPVSADAAQRSRLDP